MPNGLGGVRDRIGEEGCRVRGCIILLSLRCYGNYPSFPAFAGCNKIFHSGPYRFKLVSTKYFHHGAL